MIRTGLVSITFRQLTPSEIVSLVEQAGLEAIEWGGDVHVPHGDVDQARVVRRMTVDAGLTASSYGSYYRVGHQEPVPFGEIVETALVLKVPLIRVWAGKQGSEAADATYWQRVIEDSRRISDLAAEAELRIAYEYHPNTLTDTNASARRLLEEVDHDAVTSYWQPPEGRSVSENLAGLEAILPWLTNLHVYSWERVGGERERQRLEAGGDEWQVYLDRVAATDQDHYALIEFVRHDDPENFLKDAETLKGWLARY